MQKIFNDRFFNFLCKQLHKTLDTLFLTIKLFMQILLTWFFIIFHENFECIPTFTPLNPLTKRLLIPKVLKSDFLPSKISIFMTLSQQHVNNNFFLIKSLTQTCFKLIHIPKIRKWENIFSWLSFISFCHNIKKKSFRNFLCSHQEATEASKMKIQVLEKFPL